MPLRHLITHRHNGPQGQKGLLSLREEMDRLFDDWFNEMQTEPLVNWEGHEGAFTPRIDVADNEKELRVTAELPGMDEKDIEVSFEGDRLMIRGEKKEEREEKKKEYYRKERFYGSFQREIPLACKVEEKKIDASFKKGVLTITMPKTIESQRAARKISVKAG